MEQGQRLWDLLWEAGRPHGVVPVGIGVYGTTGRLEKGYRAYGHELEQEFDLVECGLARPSVKPQAFIGKEAYLEQRAKPPAAVLCTLTVDDHRSASGVPRYMLGREPILTPGGEPLVDAKGRRSYVTSAGAGPSVGKHLLMSYLPPDHARWGRSSPWSTSPSGTRSRSPSAGSTPLFDPAEPADAAVNVLVCVKRVPAAAGKLTLTPDEQDDRHRHLGFTVSPHEECAVEEAVRLVAAHGGAEHRPDARARGGDRAAPRRDGDRHRPRRAPGDRRRRVGSDGHRRRHRRRDPGPAGGGRRLRPAPLRQRGGRQRGLPGRRPGRPRPRPALRDRREGHRGPGRGGSPPDARRRAAGRSSRSPCPPSSRSRKASTSRATPPFPAG